MIWDCSGVHGARLVCLGFVSLLAFYYCMDVGLSVGVAYIHFTFTLSYSATFVLSLHTAQLYECHCPVR